MSQPDWVSIPECHIFHVTICIGKMEPQQATIRPMRIQDRTQEARTVSLISLGRSTWSTVRRVVTVVAAILLFVLALKLLQAGASGLAPILDVLSVDSVASSLGFGWLGAYIVLSGSPVAAIAIALYGGGELTQQETFGMLVGSRFGAAMVVLVVGVLAFLRGGVRSTDGVYIGVTALITTFSQFLPALFIGLFILDQGWIGDGSIPATDQVDKVLDATYGPVVDWLKDRLPDLLLFAVGAPLLVGAFQLFDKALPVLEEDSLRGSRYDRLLHHPLSMFALGLAITAVTLSVSLSLTLLVPLAMKGFVRRDRVIPYVMGANISTWIDTLVAAVLVGREGATAIVLAEMISGFAVAIGLLAIYPLYSRFVRASTDFAMRGRASLAGFVVIITAVPALLLFVG